MTRVKLFVKTSMPKFYLKQTTLDEAHKILQPNLLAAEL